MILGIKIVNGDVGPMLSQEHYVEKFLRKFGFFDCKPVSTPYDTNTQLKKMHIIVSHNLNMPKS